MKTLPSLPSMETSPLGMTLGGRYFFFGQLDRILGKQRFQTSQENRTFFAGKMLYVLHVIWYMTDDGAMRRFLHVMKDMQKSIFIAGAPRQEQEKRDHAEIFHPHTLVVH